MFRTFLSWRYMFARRTNLIGMVGIFVAVGALILILSIMTGFLEESRKTVRGSLADVLVEPLFERSIVGARTVPRDPGPLLDVVRADPRVKGATPQLVWGGMITQSGRNFERYLSSPTNPGRLVVQLIGVDIRTAERIGYPMIAAAARALGGAVPPLRIQDQFDATDLLRALLPRDDDENRRDLFNGAPVPNPLFPFARLNYQPQGRPKRGIVVGEQLFASLGMRRGDELQIATFVPDPESGEWVINNREFVVVGTFRSGENEADLQRIYFERPELQDFLGGNSEFTQVLVRLNDYERDGEAVTLALRDELSDRGLIQGQSYARYEVRTWEEFRQNLMGAIENERVLMGIMLSLVLVVAGFTIFAILSMMVTEKRRDIGILGALGATPTGVMHTFLMIAFWDALLGATLGAVFGTWAAIRIDALERWLSDVFNVQIFNRDVYLFDHIPSIVQPLSVALIVLGAFFCALLFAFIPAWRASRLDPLEALRYE